MGALMPSIISSENAPAPAGHYSQAIVYGGLVYVSGQLPVNPATRAKCTGPIEDQTQLALENVAAILEAAGSSVDRVLKTTVYVSDISSWPQVNDVYSRFFGSHRPARAVVPTRDLHFGLKVEVEAVAALVER